MTYLAPPLVVLTELGSTLTSARAAGARVVSAAPPKNAPTSRRFAVGARARTDEMATKRQAARMVATRMLRVTVVSRRVCCVSRWCSQCCAGRCSKLHRLSWPQRFTGAHRDLIEHTCCLTATNVDE